MVLQTVYTQIYLRFINKALARASDQQLEEKPRLMNMMDLVLYCISVTLHVDAVSFSNQQKNLEFQKVLFFLV